MEEDLKEGKETSYYIIEEDNLYEILIIIFIWLSIGCQKIFQI